MSESKRDLEEQDFEGDHDHLEMAMALAEALPTDGAVDLDVQAGLEEARSKVRLRESIVQKEVHRRKRRGILVWGRPEKYRLGRTDQVRQPRAAQRPG